MAGTLFGLGLSQQFDVNGDPLHGCKLYIYYANTSSPVLVYKDIGLTILHPNPIIADSTGRIPAFWLADGSYRATLLDENNIVQFNETSIAAVGPSTGAVAPSVPTEVVASTGDVKWRPHAGDITGWVRMHGGTIGNGSSSATYASSTTEALFLHAYGAFDNTICPVSGGRTGNAANDFASAKRLTLLDLRGRTPWGLDDMGQPDSLRLNGAYFPAGMTRLTPGGNGGAGTHVLLQGEIPDFLIGGAGSISVTVNDTRAFRARSGLTAQATGGVSAMHAAEQLFDDIIVSAQSGSITADATHNLTTGGGSVGHNNLPPVILGTWYWKL
jgi:hypothetical protein